MMRIFTCGTIGILLTFLCLNLKGSNFQINLHASATEVSTYSFMEFTMTLKKPVTENPFTDVLVKGVFTINGNEITATGFCDSQDGTVFKIRYMPAVEGKVNYTITFTCSGKSDVFTGNFQANKSGAKGIVRIDKDYPGHFVWEGTGEHYFWNGTTTYFLMGWEDDKKIEQIIDRLASMKVNRMRVAINGRAPGGQAWAEPNVQQCEEFKFYLTPWVAQRPADLEDPGYDVTRFNVPYWQKIDRMLAHARSHDMIISLVFYVDGIRGGTDPFKLANCGNIDEQRFYSYAASRFSAFSNIMWDLANEYKFFRNDAWAEKMGPFLKKCDPYNHLMSVHGFPYFNFRTSPWADFALYQCWDQAGGFDFMWLNKQVQQATGRMIPQINEEYGYESHYPTWGNGVVPPGRSDDNRRRLAWGIYMSGGYQTNGERADFGTCAGKKTGGGWINGGGDSTMVMFKGFEIISNIFHELEWWKMEPNLRIVNHGPLCLEEPGKQYLTYNTWGGLEIQLVEGTYNIKVYNAATGKLYAETEFTGHVWKSTFDPSGDDWAVIFKRK
jgi:hypothetical protein